MKSQGALGTEGASRQWCFHVGCFTISAPAYRTGLELVSLQTGNQLLQSAEAPLCGKLFEQDLDPYLLLARMPPCLSFISRTNARLHLAPVLL